MKRGPIPGPAAAASLSLTLGMGAARAKVEKSTIAPGHGLTADTFCITVQKGAHAAADAPGAELVFLGAPDFNAVTQVPVPDATVGG